MQAGGNWITIDAAVRLLGRATGRVYLGGSAAEPCALLDAVDARRGLWQGLTLTGAFIPGITDRAPPQGSVFEGIFGTPGLQGHPGWRHLPLHYGAYWRRLATPGLVSHACLTVPPPAPDGTIGLGLGADFAPAVISAGAVLIEAVNPAMPDPPGAPRLPLSRFAALVAAPGPLPGYDPGPPDAAMAAIASRIAALPAPGDTLQLGLGKMQGAVLAALAAARVGGLHYAAGMISTPMLAALRAGVFASVTTGVAVGDAAFYAGLAAWPAIRFRPVAETHDHARLAALPGFTAVNAVIEVDLFGQANAETIGGRQISGQGGLVDFLRAARASPGGRAVLALPATALGGRSSRILACLPQGVPVSVALADVQWVVTEYGIADLSDANPDTRAARLIGLAAPAFRDGLATAWARLRGAGPA